MTAVVFFATDQNERVNSLPCEMDSSVRGQP